MRQYQHPKGQRYVPQNYNNHHPPGGSQRQMPPSDYHRSPLQAIETNSFPRSAQGIHNHHRPPAPMPPGGIQQRTPRHLPPEIPQKQNIYGRTPPKLHNSNQSPAQSTPPNFQNMQSPSNYQNSSHGSSSNSRDSSNPGSKV